MQYAGYWSRPIIFFCSSSPTPFSKPKPDSLWPAPVPGRIWPPGTSRLPVMAIRATVTWPCCMPSVFWSAARPHWMAPGLAEAYMRAAARILSAGTPQISAAFSAGMVAHRSASWSKP